MSKRELAFYLNPAGPSRRDIMQLLAEAGVRKIGIDGHPRGDGERAFIDSFLNDCREFGLSVYSMHAMCPLHDRPDAHSSTAMRAKVESDIERMALFGGKTAVFHACQMSEMKPHDADAAIGVIGTARFIEHYAASVRCAAKIAAKHGITLVLENIGGCTLGQSIAGIKEIIAAANEPNVGFILDAGHAHVAGVVAAEEIRIAGKLLCDTHFHDNIGKTPWTGDQHLPVGLGTINWQDVCAALDEVGFPGPVVFEGVLGGGDVLANRGFARDFTHRDAIALTIANWRAFEILGESLAIAKTRV
ncbi:MAG: sugar phosphate isomerase/epimerase [Spirochaetes bacterium]|nr:sugar phosphate isomerase/epimerase [Spirochaetota bacterium]